MNTRFCPTCRRNFGTLARCPEDETDLLSLPTEYPAPGLTIDDVFVLEAAIAVGGMSRVYRARNGRTSEVVAVKVLDPRLATHPYTIERFYREARVSLLLDHANVVAVQTFGPTAEGHHAVVMELLGGESLGSALRREGHLPWVRALHILLELCDALGHAHGRRVVHRDIKPENIQLMGTVGPDERVKLMDFGIAYVSADSNFSEAAPGSTHVSGTPAYMSPEQIRGIPLDGRSDVYALGVLLFEMLTGRRPFEGDDPIEVCRAQLYERPPGLDEALPPGVVVPAELHALVRQMLTKARSSRVPSVGALMGRLMSAMPQNEWPTRLRRKRTVMPSTPRRHPTGNLMKRPTGEFFRAPPNLSVTLVQIEVDGASDLPTGTAAWTDAVDQVLAGWRALVEETGGLIHQPEPNAMRVVMGLFRPSRRASDLWEAVLHAMRLRDLFDQHFVGPERELGLRCAVLRGETVVADEQGRETGISQADVQLARALVRAAPPGAIVVDHHVREQLEDYALFFELEPLAHVEGERGRVFLVEDGKV